jgi:ABC-type sugar transport system substrate-binding protein
LAQRELGLVAAIAAVVFPIMLINPRMLSAANLTALSMDAALLIIVAVAQMLVIITRNIDLSVASVLQEAPSQATAEAQIEFINNLVSRKVGVIAIAGNDANAVAPALKRAAKQGVKIISYDSDVARDARTLFLNQAKGDSLAEMMLTSMGELIGYDGEFAILSSTPTATNQNAWIAFMKARMPRIQSTRRWSWCRSPMVRRASRSISSKLWPSLRLSQTSRGSSFPRASACRPPLVRWSRLVYSES